MPVSRPPFARSDHCDGHRFLNPRHQVVRGWGDALLPIGAYEPRWFMAAHHCNPLETIRIHLDLGAVTSLAMPWGTFRLTDEGREEPVQALIQARQSAHVPAPAFRILTPGETFRC